MYWWKRVLPTDTCAVAAMAHRDRPLMAVQFHPEVVHTPQGHKILSNVVHMKIGIEVIIEDYVHDEKQKLTLLMLNSFFSIAIGLACAYAVLKLSFGV